MTGVDQSKHFYEKILDTDWLLRGYLSLVLIQNMKKLLFR